MRLTARGKTTGHDRALSLVEAARFIFRTRTPTDKQLRRVYEQMKAGALKVRDYGGPPLRWTTTEAALAEFLAARQVEQNVSDAATANARRLEKDPSEPPTAKRPPNLEHDAEQLRAVYENVWRDFFLAMMWRRRMSHRSKSFRRAVLTAQIVMLIVFVGIIVGTVRLTWKSVLAEHIAIQKFIATDTDEHVIEQWFPTELTADGLGQRVRVRYRYRKESPRMIHTDREFEVRDGEVREVGSDS